MTHSTSLLKLAALLVASLAWSGTASALAPQGPIDATGDAGATADRAPLLAWLSAEPDPAQRGSRASRGSSRSSGSASRVSRPSSSPRVSSPQRSRGSVSPQRGSVSPQRGSVSPSRGSVSPSRGASQSPSRGVAPQPSRGVAPQPSRGVAPQPSRGIAPQPSRGIAPQPSRGVAPQPSRPGVTPTPSSPGVRTYDAPRSTPAPGVGAVRSYDGAGRQSPAPSAAGGPSGRISPSPSTFGRGAADQPTNLIDLTGSARAPRVRFPELGSTSARGPAARRGEAASGSPSLGSRSGRTSTYDAARTRAVADGLENARVRQVDEDGLRSRYRGPANDRGVSQRLAGRDAADRGTPPSTPAERARRAPGSVRLRQALGDDQSGLEARRTALLRRNQASPARTRGGAGSVADNRPTRRLPTALPAADPAVEKARRGAAVATEVAVGVGLGVTVGVFGGSPGAFCGTGYPYYGYGYGYGYGSNCGWYAGWSWGFNFCWWSSSYWSPFCFGYSPWWRSPYYCSWYSPRYYYPIYYSYPVYYPSEPVYYEAPAQTTYVEEQQPIAGEAAVAATETVPSPDLDLQASLSRAASYYLNLGDHAFRDGRYADAVHFYAKAVEYAPDQGVLYLILSDALFATGDYHYAAYALRKAVELDPTLFDAPVDKRTFYSDPEDFDRQLATLELYLQDHFIDDDARLVLAANYLFGDRPAAAVDLLQESFSESLRGSPAGMRVLESARAIQYGR